MAAELPKPLFVRWLQLEGLRDEFIDHLHSYPEATFKEHSLLPGVFPPTARSKKKPRNSEVSLGISFSFQALRGFTKTTKDLEDISKLPGHLTGELQLLQRLLVKLELEFLLDKADQPSDLLFSNEIRGGTDSTSLLISSSSRILRIKRTNSSKPRPSLRFTFGAVACMLDGLSRVCVA